MKKNILLLAISLVLLAGCGASRQTAAEKSAEAQQVAGIVDQRLNEKNYRIDVNYMMPLRGGGKMLSGTYSLEVNGDEVDSHLPYLGVAQNVPYGGGQGLDFKAEIKKYSDDGWKKGLRQIAFTTNNGEDTYEFNLSISDEGFAEIRIHCRNRDDIGFHGSMDTRETDNL
jgi:hypothetical protein